MPAWIAPVCIVTPEEPADDDDEQRDVDGAEQLAGVVVADVPVGVLDPVQAVDRRGERVDQDPLRVRGRPRGRSRGRGARPRRARRRRPGRSRSRPPSSTIRTNRIVYAEGSVNRGFFSAAARCRRGLRRSSDLRLRRRPARLRCWTASRVRRPSSPRWCSGPRATSEQDDRRPRRARTTSTHVGVVPSGSPRLRSGPARAGRSCSGPPPRPLPSSKPSIVITSTPASRILRDRVGVALVGDDDAGLERDDVVAVVPLLALLLVVVAPGLDHPQLLARPARRRRRRGSPPPR